MLKGFAAPPDPDLLVGFATSDDAAVYRLSPETAVISTVDFITPPVDDPYWFGQIAAANSLSDVYAMGGRPILALNLVMFPSKALDLGLLREILRGGNDKVAEAGACMAGGHSVEDNEPKYGLSVTGLVHPDRVWTNAGARAGDALVLTKPLGTGVLFNASRAGKLPYAELETILPAVAGLNAASMETARGFEVHACTDVTGFGIVGHTVEMARASGLGPPGLPEPPVALPGAAPGPQGPDHRQQPANRTAEEAALGAPGKPSADQEVLLFDPHTSGGLLLAVPRAQADALAAALRAAGVAAAARVGEVTDCARPVVTVR